MSVLLFSRKGFLLFAILSFLVCLHSCTDSPGSGNGGGDNTDTIRPSNQRVYKLKPIYIDVVDSANSPETLRKIADIEKRLQARIDRLNKSGKGQFQFSIQKTVLITNEKKQVLLIERRIHMMKCFPCTVPPDEEEDSPDDSSDEVPEEK